MTSKYLFLVKYEEMFAISSFDNELYMLLKAPVISNEELVGGLFQETTDNSRNFPDMKSFHAFKNQR